MKQQKRTWQEVTGAKQEVVFVNDEVTCPTCESYSVDELVAECRCERCGETWVLGLSRK